MFKLFRKVAVGAIIVASGLFLLSAAGMSSYTGTVWSKVQNGFKKQVPIEFEIERLRYQVTQLVPDMKKHLSSIAEEMVAIDNLREEVTEARANLDKQKAGILAMTHDLENGTQVIVYGGREYPAQRIKEKLDRDLSSYKRAQSELKSREQLLEAREKSLDTAKEQLAAMRSQKEELEVQVAQLEADLKTVRLAQTRSKFEIDDSQLAQCKATLADIRNRLKVEKTAVELQGQFANDNAIQVDKRAKSTKEVVKEVHEFFGNSSVAEKK